MKFLRKNSWHLSKGVVACLLFLCGTLLGAFCNELSADSPEQKFEQIRTAYFRLRNTDPQLRKLDEWRTSAKELENFTTTFPKSRNAPEALFHRAVIEEQIFRVFGGEDHLLQAVEFLRQLVKNYPENELADDGLLRAADLFFYDLGETNAATQLYQKVVQKFPRSDAAEAAKVRLKDLADARIASVLASRRTGTPNKSGRVDSKTIIVLDPGHGGEDFGAKGPGGLLEKDVTLAVALRLERRLTEELGITVFLTRKADRFVPLAERTAFANGKQATLFLSLHNNASPKASLSGVQTFYLDTAGDEASRLLAQRENGVEQTQGAGGDLAFILSDLTQNAKLGPSLALSYEVHRTLINHLRRKWDFVRDRGVRPAPFYVLVGAHMPCALVELFFIDNAVDGAHLADKDFRDEVVDGLFLGIQRFLESDSAKYK